MIQSQEKIEQTEWNDAYIYGRRRQDRRKTRVPDVGWQPLLELGLLSKDANLECGFTTFLAVPKRLLFFLKSSGEFFFQGMNASGQIRLDLGHHDTCFPLCSDTRRVPSTPTPTVVTFSRSSALLPAQPVLFGPQAGRYLWDLRRYKPSIVRLHRRDLFS